MLRSNFINTSEQLSEVELEWNGLLSQSNNNEIFLTYEWISIWWKIFKTSDKELMIITIRNNDELVGIAPLYLEKKFFKVLKFMSSAYPLYPDYLNFIIKRGFEEEVTKLILLNITQIEWDYICLSDIYEQNRVISYIKEFGQDILGKVYENVSTNCAYAELPSSYEVYLKSLSTNYRGKVSNSINRARKSFDLIEYGEWPKDDILRGLDELAHLHRKRWTHKKEIHTFRDKEYINFHKYFLERGIKNNWINIHYFKLNNKIVALIYLFYYGEKTYYYQSGFDPEYYKYSPGVLLLNYVIKKAIENGRQEFDFLRGEHRYKNSWANSSRKTICIRIFNNNLKGRLLLIKYFLFKILTYCKKQTYQKGHKKI